MKIVVEEYNPIWEVDFFKESKLLSSINNFDAIIEHIGSTSVQGLGAKPVIDIMIGLKDFSKANNYIKNIENLSYSYIQRHEDVMPFRRFFIKENMGIRTHHVHMVEIDSEFWNRHLKFRNHLRDNKKDRDAYFKLKKELSQKEWEDGNEYAHAKTEFIRAIEATF